MSLFKNEYPANTSNLWNESLLDIAAGVGCGGNDGNRLRLDVTLAGAGVPSDSGPAVGTETEVAPPAVCAPAGTTETAKKAHTAIDVITPSFFIFPKSP
jgi:hypothetical protein